MLTDRERQIRANIRNFLLVATPDELTEELCYSVKRNDTFRASCIQEMMTEQESAMGSHNFSKRP
jgi:hypothetical protein